MRETLLKFLGLRIDAISQFIISLSFYEEIIEGLDESREKAEKIYQEFKEKINDEEYVKSIDYYEQRALAENAQNYSQALKQINHITESLIAKKFTRNINQLFFYLEDFRLTIKDLISGYYDLSDVNKNVSVKNPINETKFKEAGYKTKLSMILAAVSTLRDDVSDEVDLIPEAKDKFIGQYYKQSFISNLGKMEMLLQEEIEDIEVNGMPKKETYDLPDIVEPEEPEGPEEEEKKVDAEQGTIKFEDAQKNIEDKQTGDEDDKPTA